MAPGSPLPAVVRQSQHHQLTLEFLVYVRQRCMFAAAAGGVTRQR